MTSLPAPDDTHTLQGQQQQSGLWWKIFIRRKNTPDLRPRQRASPLNGLEGTTAHGFEFDAQQPIVMKLFRGEPFFKLLAPRSVEFHEHLPLLHVDENTPRRHGGSGVQPLGE